MVKKNASLAGRGVEILFGTDAKDDEETPSSAEGPSVVIDVEADEPAEGTDGVAEDETSGAQDESDMPSDAAVDLADAEPIDPEWAAMMEAEAENAEPVSGSEGELFSTPSDEGVTVWPSATYVDDVVDLTLGEDRPAAPEPEEEMASLAMAPAGESVAELDSLATAPIGEPATDLTSVAEPSAWDVPAQEPLPSATTMPAGETYTPPVGASVSEQPPAELPLPRDKSGEAQVAQRIESLRISGTLYDSGVTVGSGDELLPETPEMGDLQPEVVKDYERDQASRVRSEKEIIEYVGFKQRQKLWDEIDELYDQVPEILSTHEEQKDALRLLREAQDILMEKPRQYDVAKFKVSQVKTILKRRSNITLWTDGLAWFIFGYDIVWISVVFYLVFLFNLEPILRTALKLTDPLAAKDMLVLDNSLRLWNTLLWGGIGGVVNGFYGLFRHASQKKDFDRQYLMWYIAQPVIGFMLGGLTHLILGTGFLSTTGIGVGGEEVEVALFPSLVAWIAGFRQEFVLKLIDGIIRLLTPSTSDQGSSSSGSNLGAQT